MDKIEQIQLILEELKELYPNLEKILVDNLENPNYIMVATNEYFQYMSKSLKGSKEDSIPHSISSNKKYH